VNHELITEPALQFQEQFVDTCLVSNFLNGRSFKSIRHVKLLVGERASVCALKVLDGATVQVVIDVVGLVFVEEVGGF